jgi:hypothetical protein
MTNEVYEASVYEITQESSSAIYKINESISKKNALPIELFFMIGGKISISYHIDRVNNYRIDGITRIKDGFGNVVATDSWIQSNTNKPDNILIDAKPFEKYSFELEIDESNISRFDGIVLVASGFLHRKSKFVSIKG